MSRSDQQRLPTSSTLSRDVSITTRCCATLQSSAKPCGACYPKHVHAFRILPGPRSPACATSSFTSTSGSTLTGPRCRREPTQPLKANFGASEFRSQDLSDPHHPQTCVTSPRISLLPHASRQSRRLRLLLGRTSGQRGTDDPGRVPWLHPRHRLGARRARGSPWCAADHPHVVAAFEVVADSGRRQGRATGGGRRGRCSTPCGRRRSNARGPARVAGPR